jgi:hypothetical protein
MSGSVNRLTLSSWYRDSFSYKVNIRPIEDIPVSVKYKYNNFNKLRMDEKKNIYYNVMTRGSIILTIGLVSLVVSWILTFIFIQVSGAFVFGIILGIPGFFLCTCGIVCISSVPTDEVDMDEIIENEHKPWRKYVISIIFFLINLVTGIITGLFPPYLGFIFVLNALWIIKSVLYQEEKFNFMVKMAFGFQIALLVLSSMFLVCAVSPETMVHDNFAGVNGDAWQQWIENSHNHRLLLGLYYGILALLFFTGWFVSGFLCIRYFYKYNSNKELLYIDESEKKKGYKTKLFHIIVYVHLVCAGIQQSLFGVFSIFVKITSDYMTSYRYYYLPYIFNGILCLIPMLYMFKVGRVRMFSMMARKFEYDYDRLKKDGAFMAELIHSTTVVFQGDIRWYQRPKEDKVYETEKNDGSNTYVNREFFVKGIVTEVTATDVLLEVSYKDDISLDWQVKFEADDSSMTFKQTVTYVNLYKHNTGKLQITFDEWFSKNFNDCKFQICNVDKQMGIVTIREKIFEESLPTKEYLLDWALDNLRCLNFSNFKDSLFLISPRALGNEDERNATFALSHAHKPSLSSDHSSSIASLIRFRSWFCGSEDLNQIDFFISHSWADQDFDAEKKCAILRSFSEQFKNMNGKEPTYWLDKVCIDQSRVNDSDYYALHVLPVNISSCKQVLVLLGKSYMKRLWCLWELYCLFVFCNKELALDRVEVKLLHEEDAGTVFDELAKFKLTEGTLYVRILILYLYFLFC